MTSKLNHLGFTLLELLTVVLILFILTLIAIPIFTNLIRDYRINTIAEDIYNTLQFARMEAIRIHKPTYFFLQPDFDWCFAVGTAKDCYCQATVTNCNLYHQNASDKTLNRLYQTNIGNNIQFEPTHGYATALGPVTIKVTPFDSETPAVIISVSRLGIIKMCSIDLSGYPPC